MVAAHIVVHYHELWLKQGNRLFFLHKLRQAMRQALEGIPVSSITQPGDRYVIELAGASVLPVALDRLSRVSGIANCCVARSVEWRNLETPAAILDAVRQAAWSEVRSETFSTFAVRSTRSDKRFPFTGMQLEREVGGFLYDRLEAAGRAPRVNLKHPDLTCRIEVSRGPVLIHARRIPGPGGLPANTAGRLVCLISGGFDSSVAAYKMMKRGAHLIFVHFWGGGGPAGESSLHAVRALLSKLVPWQFTAKLFLVPFESLQREIVFSASETFRILLYRRLMFGIAQRIALRERARGLITGDSLGQVASQTAQNMQAVGTAVRLPVYRPLVGDDKLEIQELARRIGTFEISAEPSHDCCPAFQPKVPALFASPEELDAAEAQLDTPGLVNRGLQSMTIEKFRYVRGEVERTAPRSSAPGRIPEHKATA